MAFHGYVILLSFIFSLGLPLGHVASAATNSPQRVRVLTLNFNSEAVPVDRDNYLRDKRFKLMVDYIREQDVDVVLIQEGWNYRHDASIAQTLARALDYDVAYRLVMGAPFLFYDSDAVLSKKKFNMTDEYDIKLPHSAWSVGDGKHEILVFGSISYAIGAKLWLDNGQPLYTYSTHLIGGSESDRRDQILAIDDAFRAQAINDGYEPEKVSALITGDMNSLPTESSMTSLRGIGYQDIWQKTHPDKKGPTSCSIPESACFNPITIGSGLVPTQHDIKQEDRIDYIYVNSPLLVGATAARQFLAPVQGVWVSDHYGILSDLYFGNTLIDGLDSTPMPNPLVSLPSDEVPNLPLATVLHIKSKFFACPVDKTCRRRLPGLTVKGPRGLALVDDANIHINAAVKGPGRILTRADTTLKKGDGTAFVFESSGEYSLEMNDGHGNSAHAQVFVELN